MEKSISRPGREFRDAVSVRQQLRMLKYLPRIKAYKQIQGWLAPVEAAHLYHYASQLEKQDPTIVEIGSWKGKSTLCIAKALQKGRIYAIDPFNATGEEESLEIFKNSRGDADLREEFLKNMRANGIEDRVEPLKGYSRDHAERFEDETIDMLFIDGDHSYEGCLFDYEAYAPRIPSGGYLLFHDYRPSRKDYGVTRVINEVVIPSGKFEKAGLYLSLWVARKK